MRPIGREGGDGSAQSGRSLISTTALFLYSALSVTCVTMSRKCKPIEHSIVPGAVWAIDHTA